MTSRHQPRSTSRPRTLSNRRGPYVSFADQVDQIPSSYLKYPTWDPNSPITPRSTTAPRRRSIYERKRSVVFEPEEVEPLNDCDEPGPRTSRFIAWTILALSFSLFLGAVLHLKEGIESPWKTVGKSLAGGIELARDLSEEISARSQAILCPIIKEFGRTAKVMGFMVVDWMFEVLERLKDFWARAQAFLMPIINEFGRAAKLMGSIVVDRVLEILERLKEFWVHAQASLTTREWPSRTTASPWKWI